ncbi:hypothetical protein [Streptomyces sp. LN785]|uniref:hypothetical protein n=1 Tax=Streptomyces sp. LN785 TaxID=3112983 RepID=UPI00371260A6
MRTRSPRWDPLSRPALGGDPAALVLRVQVFHVQGQHLIGPCGRLVEHHPLRLLPQGDVQAPQGDDLAPGIYEVPAPREAIAATWLSYFNR